MVILLTVLTATYAVVVVRVCRARRRARLLDRALLAGEVPAADRPPSSAVGWPPTGAAFTGYVEQGIAALDGYLSEGSSN